MLDEYLARCTNLKSLLILSSRPITDAGLVHLAKLTALEEINLGRTQATDAGRSALARAERNFASWDSKTRDRQRHRQTEEGVARAHCRKRENNARTAEHMIEIRVGIIRG